MSNRPLRLEVTVNSSEPRLLEGLDYWLQLGLISESHVRWVAKQYLTCPLPELVTESTVLQRPPRDFTPETVTPVLLTPVRQRNNLFSQAWQSFKDEISIRWWLFLGLFLVVASSGGMAATQWQRFPDTLQYGILWSYTLIFWIVGFWANRQEGLRLTAQTLQTIALLLIPVNFWAMDGLGGNPLSWITIAIASISLTTIYFFYRQSSQSIFLFFNFIGLSYLHWGWEWKEYPAIAVYIGVVVTAIILRFFSQQQANASPVKINPGFVIYALSVLLIRAIFIVNLPIQQLGLAIGVCGWLMQGASFEEQGGQGGQGGQGRDFSDSQFLNHQSPITNRQFPNRQSPVTKTLEIIGAILLFIAWLVCLTETFPWQAMGVSLLGLHFFTQRLRRDWLRRDLFAIFIIGWQAHFLIGRLIPGGFKQDAIDLSIQIAKSEAFPWTVYGITLFPYLICFVWLTGWLYRQDRTKLALFGEWLTFALGMVMTLVSLYNPTWRSLNLFLSTCTLVYVVRHRTPIRVALLYFTHGLGLLTVCVTIDWWFPSLPSSIWASIFLGLAVVEWVSHAETQRRRERRGERIQGVWCRSCWHFGFVLASISYPLLWERVEAFFATGESQSIVLSWMLVPLTLTGVALRMGGKRRRRATIFSSYASILAQVLTIWQPSTRLVSLGVASGLMLVNSRYYRHPIAAAIQIGFSLCFVAAFLWEKLSVSGWFLFGAIAISTLWLLSSWLRQQNTILASLYRKAADSWAITLCAIAIILLTCKTLFSYWSFPIPHWHYLATPLIISGAILYRYRQQLNNYAIYGIVWTIELAICEEVLLIHGSNLAVAIVNIILGLFSLLITDWLLERQSPLSSLKILPLIFALLGIFWRWDEFNTYTGLLTLGAALTGIGVGYRLRGKVITYCSLIGISLAGYELVIYQMLQSSGGNPADGLTILAFVAAAIALIYRLFATLLQSRDRNNFLNLSLTEIKITAHSHWALGSILKILAAGLATENPPQLRSLGIAISLLLAIYALIQGRDPQTRNRTASDWWVYVGLVEIVATTVYARLIWQQLSILDPFRVIIVCIVALFIYQIPWRSLGWELTPWHRFAASIPALTTLVTIEDISYLSLLVVAAFYGRIALRQKEIRWTYISLVFIDLAIARFLWENSLTDILWYASIIGLSLLYIAQLDPTLSQPQQRNNRHILRISGSGIICFIALLFNQETGLTPTIISLVAIFLGLGLQIRAFLFVGTITFILTGFYQLVILSFERPLAKWIIGLIAGIIFIFIAANFERRREAIMRVIQNWIEKLTYWE